MNLNFTFINFSVLIFLILFYFLEIRSKKIFKYRTIIYLILFIPLILYTFGDNLSAKWWIIDDHEIFYYLTPNTETQSTYGLWFIDTLIHKTEIGQFGDYPRYRLSYFPLRILEAYLFQDSAFYYYSLRLIFILYFFFTLFLLVTRYLTFAIGIGILLLVFSETYWSDIFSRLGPGEWYCLVGTSIIFHVFSNSKSFIKYSFLENIFLSFGIILAAGSKENFFILIFLSLYLIYINFRNRKIILTIISIIPVILIVFSIVPLGIYFLKQPSDMYGNSTKLLDRIMNFIPFVKSLFFMNSLWIGIASLSSICILIFKSNVPRYLTLNKKNIYLIFSLLILFLFNVVFYNSIWPTNSRYDFPGLFVYQMMIVITLSLCLTVLINLLDINRKLKLIVRNAFLICIICFFVNFKSIDSLKEYSQINSKRTNEYTNFVNHFIQDFKLKNQELVFFINRGWDLEPLIAFHRFLSYYGIHQKNFILVSNKNEFNKHHRELMEAMRSFSINGSDDYYVKPINFNILKNSDCIVLVFSPSHIEDFEDINVCKSTKVELIPF